MEKFGGPGGIRTPDFLLRRQTLYPAELQARNENFDEESGGEGGIRRFSAIRAEVGHPPA